MKPEWGTKRACPKCGKRFYDMGKSDPVVCVECELEWVPEPILKSKQPIVEAKKKPAPQKKKKAADDDDKDDDGVEADDDKLDSGADDIVVDGDGDDEEDIDVAKAKEIKIDED